MQIITHRGLEPLNKNFNFKESSKQAFENQLSIGYGIEFDINISKDNQYFIFHDEGFNRITNGKIKINFSDLNYLDIINLGLDNGIDFIGFEELIILINKYRLNGEFSALHLKANFQNNEIINYIIGIFKKYNLYDKIFIFDIKINTAKYFKKNDLNIKLFPSVAHEYDIKRFNTYTGGTLLSINEVINNINLFDGVWLDEWDRKNNEGLKKLYTKETFNIFRNNGLKIGLVTPELHSSSPGLLGGESHEDCQLKVKLIKRFKEIYSLNPDFICTDYINLI